MGRIRSVLTLTVLVMGASISPASAAVTISPTSGPPGTNATATGLSSDLGEDCATVHVYFDPTRNSQGKVTSEGKLVGKGPCDDGSGNFNVPFTVPRNASRGNHVVLVEGYDSAERDLHDGMQTLSFTVT